VAGESVKRELQYDFGSTRGPGPLTFDILKAFNETAMSINRPANSGSAASSA
jgi:hypothetical protein